MIPRVFLVALLFLAACRKPDPPAAYAAPKSCHGCHAAIWTTYRDTGMARSFHDAHPGNLTVESWNQTVHHKASGRDYRMIERAGRYFLERSVAGHPESTIELEIHAVMGSGNHARSYLHRTAEGRLAELPIAWYPGVGFAMAPGYDRPDPPDHRRKISTDCMFCHNGYPSGTYPRAATEPRFPASLPQGIDCQRCHGPGQMHVESAGRAPIVNPAKLPRERRIEVCLQCHLETTSAPLPNALVRFGRGPFSYRPGEPLADFMIHFDHAPGTGRESKFEIVNSAYRLRQSACYLKSGTLECATCHNPHVARRGPAARRHYDAVCRGCHAQVEARDHTAATTGCTSCHMPARTAEDVVNARMTDHRIQRRPGLEPPARTGNYQGEVALYYPEQAAPGDELYVATAQVVAGSNPAGAGRLEQALARSKPTRPEFYFALGDARSKLGDGPGAQAAFRASLAADPSFVPALAALGGAANLEKARALDPGDPGVSHRLALAYQAEGRLVEATGAARAAIAASFDFAEAHNTLGLLLHEQGDGPNAQAALREALRHRPSYAEAHKNLAVILHAAGDGAGAEHHLRASVRYQPGDTEAWQSLGDLAARRAAWVEAEAAYRAALKAAPGRAGAELGLGSALAARGRRAEALEHLRRAAESGDGAAAEEARDLMRSLNQK
ncbi:MAG: tetratricopeptide repeat protein [Acidobacteria bacterium]|nr:tetratricopeptide repeat protein [Acidobacteriota bacterium]